MKKAGKVFRYLLITFLAVLVLLIVTAWLAEDKIVRIALDQVSKSTQIPIEVEEVEFSLIHNFPLATLQCNHLWVGSPEAGREKDTLLYVGQMYISVEATPLLKGIFKARKIELEEGELFYQLDSAGTSNIDFLIDTTQAEVVDTTANAIFLDIKQLSLKNIHCHYRDEQRKAKALLQLHDVELDGLINQDEYRGNIEGEASLINCAWDSTKLDRVTEAKLSFSLNYADEVLAIDDLKLNVDQRLTLAASGKLELHDGLQTALSVEGAWNALEALPTYLPDEWLNDYQLSQLGGDLQFSADVIGAVSDSLMPRVDARFSLIDGQLKYAQYPLIRGLQLKASATNGDLHNNSSTRITVDALNCQFESSSLALSGTFDDLERGHYAVKTKMDLSLSDLKAFVPDSLVQRLSGQVQLEGETRGSVPDSITATFLNSVLNSTTLNLQMNQLDARLDSSISIRNANGKLVYTPNHLRLDSLSAQVPSYQLNLSNLNLDAGFAGDYSKPEQMLVQLNYLEAAIDSSSVNLKGSLTNLLEPDYKLEGGVNVNLSDLRPYVSDSLFSTLRGKISASFQSEARASSNMTTEQLLDILFQKSSFKLNVSDFNSVAADSLLNFTRLNGELAYQHDSLWVTGLAGNYLGLDFGADSTSIVNLYRAAIQNTKEELRVHGNFSLGDLSYAWISNFIKEDSTKVQEPQKKTEPVNFSYRVNGNLRVKSMQYDNARFENIDSKFLVKENHYVFDQLHMNAFEGNATTSVRIELDADDKMVMYFKTDAKKMNVSRMIDSFHDYLVYADMGDITGENVKGLLSTRMDGKIVLKNFEPDYNSLLLNGSLNLENGAMINVKPVMEVGKVPGIGIKNLDKLYFSNMSSNLFLFKNELYIPQTEIRTTSFDAMFLGMYSFGEDYSYHIRMFLGEVLTSKSRSNLRKQAKDDGFEEDNDDVTKGRTSIYLVSKSENGKEKAWFDKKNDRKNMVARVSLRKQMVDMLFHPALVSYETEQ